MTDILKYKKFEGVKYSDEDLYLQDERRFHDAVSRGDVKNVKIYISRGFDVNAYYPVSKTYRVHMTPLIQSSIKGFVEIMKLLIAAGADVNKMDDHNRTPLNYAAVGDRADSIKVLLENNADVLLKDRYDRYFFDELININSYARKYLESYDAQKIILTQAPKIYKDFLKFIGKLNPVIEKEFAYLKTANDLNIL